MKRILGVLTITILLACLNFTLGCSTISSGLMPKDKSVLTSLWESYEQIKAVFDKITKNIALGQIIEIGNLKKIGLDPEGKNVTTLDQLTIRKLFLGDTNSGLKMEDLPLAVQEYLKDFQNCRGFEYNYENITSEGKGNLVLRILGVKKEYLVTGWKFKGYIFVRKDVVVCVIPSGTPNINQVKSNRDLTAPIGALIIGAPSKFLLH